MTRRVLVVGGGIAGLTVAERLATALRDDDVVVEVRESSDRLGGKSYYCKKCGPRWAPR